VEREKSGESTRKNDYYEMWKEIVKCERIY
jgi:hypothetical protein